MRRLVFLLLGWFVLASALSAQIADIPYSEVFAKTTYWQSSITVNGKALPLRMTLNHYPIYLGDGPDRRTIGERWKGAYHYVSSGKHLLLDGYINAGRPALEDEEACLPHRILEYQGDK